MAVPFTGLDTLPALGVVLGVATAHHDGRDAMNERRRVVPVILSGGNGDRSPRHAAWYKVVSSRNRIPKASPAAMRWARTTG